MLMFILAIPCLTISNLPWFMDLTFQVPLQYCPLQHQTLLPSPVTSTAGCWFFLWLCLFILSGVISPMISHSILGAYWSGEFIVQCPIFLPFHAVHGVLKARILKWFAIPFSSGPHFVRILHHDWQVALHSMAHSFTELDKAVVHRSVWLIFCDCGFHSVCPLMDKDKRLMEASCWLFTHCWTTIDWRMLNPTKKKDIPHPRAKEKPQQDGSMCKVTFRIKPLTHQRHSEVSSKPCAH